MWQDSIEPILRVQGLTKDFCLLNNNSILACRIRTYENAPLTIPLKMDCCTKPDAMKIKNKKRKTFYQDLSLLLD